MTFVGSMKLLKQGELFRHYPRFENEESIKNFLQVCKISKKYAESYLSYINDKYSEIEKVKRCG